MRSLAYLTPPAAARVKGCSRSTIHRAIRRGELTEHRFGGVLFVSRAELKRFHPLQDPRARMRHARYYYRPAEGDVTETGEESRE